MVIHFDNRAKAESKLASDGFTQIKNGSFVSKDGTVAASIHPVHGSEFVAVFYREIENI